MNYTDIINGLIALLFAGLISFTTTPLVRYLAYKWGAVDVPKDNRRMHKTPIPRMGGLAIYIASAAAFLIFGNISKTILGIIIGGLVIVISGILDDIYTLPPWIKLIAQIIAAIIAIWSGVLIEWINFFGTYIHFGIWAYPITFVWIIGLTNAVNLIDGLDGLACGVSAISSLALLLVTIMYADPISATLTAIIAGSCLGFLPFNSNPAKIFMGDTGALFLGFALAVISVQGVFKLHAVVSFIIPFLIFGIPIFDIVFSGIRRILKGQAPWKADRGHLHHRLIDMGLNQKQSVRILYAVSGILGISAVLFTKEKILHASIIIVLALVIGIFNIKIFKKDNNYDKGTIVPFNDGEIATGSIDAQFDNVQGHGDV